MANALTNGGTLVIDDADTSIHPPVLMNIVNIFHNDDINTSHAQLVLITHNSIFLNANLFRAMKLCLSSGMKISFKRLVFTC